MPLTASTLGQVYALTVLTPIAPHAEDALRATLARFEHEGSPFGDLGRTHFARWVVIEDFVNDPSQPTEDHLACHYLLFSATLDGELDSYLDALCAKDWAAEVWGACIGAPGPSQRAALKAYLKHNQIDTGLFFCAYPDARVEHVLRALELRRSFIDFVADAQALEPEALAAAFRTRFCGS